MAALVHFPARSLWYLSRVTAEPGPAIANETVYLPFTLDGPLAGQAAHVYARAFAQAPYYSDPVRMEVEYLRNLRERHGRKPGLTPIVAVTRGEVTGTAYGYHLRPNDWWGDMVAAALGQEARAVWLEDAFAVVEVGVLPGAQGRGVGRGMVQALLAGRPERTAVLSTRVDARAQHLYRKLGFDVLTTMTFPGNPSPYHIMGRSPATLDGLVLE